MNENIKLWNGDCLELMKDIPDGSIDMILCDLPYGTTACKWDTIIPFDKLWEQYWRISKSNAAIVLSSSQPFTTALIYSEMKNFKYSWVWEKNFSTNFLHAKRMPLRKTEDVLVFYKAQCVYNPQKTNGHKPTQSAIGSSVGKLYHGNNVRNYEGGDTTRYPVNILKINSDDPKVRIHPTQKPVALMEYLIKTYTNEGETVLDNCFGSCTTGIACISTNRKFIGIEKDKTYFNLGSKRVQDLLDKNSAELNFI